MPFTFLIGGARSGKSSLAVRLASGFHGGVVVVATAEARDEEMAERIRAHRARRPAGWATVEAPLHLLTAFERIDVEACVILDCVTLWVSNVLEAGTPEDELDREARALAASLARRDAPAFVVSNEVGLGVVPTNALARRYRDILGRVNGAFAAEAYRSFLVVAGRGLPLEDVMPG
jgi:adenosyl cobinamide kinase/adenosyl cobinamide phosphate guanylyltransferase